MVIRDEHYASGNSDFEYIYKPILDFTGDWLDSLNVTMTFGPSSNVNYLQPLLGDELSFTFNLIKFRK